MNPSSQESPTLQSAQSLPTGLFGASVVKHHGKLVRMHVIVKGIACVFGDADQMIENPAILSSHDGLVYNDERFTDYLGSLENEDALAALLIPGGYLRFEYDGHSQFLTAITEFRAIRELDDSELELLVDYTSGQWSDGIGENLATETGLKDGRSIQCQTDEKLQVRQSATR